MSSVRTDTDFATAAYGAAVAMATCSDERHPPEDAINGNSSDFWVTTGCYPQEIVIQLPHSVKAQLITVETANAKDVTFESSDDDIPGHYIKLHKTTFQDSVDLQTESYVLQQPLSMQFFKLVINEGWHSFAAVRKISIFGK
eukprot:jgi/Ulvmu1/7145/UM034_0051.1